MGTGRGQKGLQRVFTVIKLAVSDTNGIPIASLHFSRSLSARISLNEGLCELGCGQRLLSHAAARYQHHR